jgi:serine/threonine protein kinase
MQPNKIGEGGYGCIHYPNLTCANNSQYKIPRPNTLSKILKTKYANIESSEYKNMQRADPSKKYYLGDPVQCKVEFTRQNVEAIQQCEEAPTILQNLDDYSLLLMKYGGLNLRDFGKDIELWKNTAANTRKIERFWLESHRLLRGVKMLLDHGLIHSDFKPHNIVYDKKKKRLNFIDFGLMKTMISTKQDIARDEYRNTKCHFSHPFETPFLSKLHFDFFAAKSAEQKEEYYSQFVHDIEKKTTTCGKKINDFFKYIFTNSEEDKESKRTLLEEHIDMLRGFPKTFDSWNYMDSLSTFDIYGIGFTYLYMLKCSKHLLNSSLYYDMRKLFLQMISGNAVKRIKVDDCLEEYESILLNHGLLNKFGVHFEKHVYYHGKPKKMNTVEHFIDKMTFAKSKDDGRQLDGDAYHKSKVVKPTMRRVNRLFIKKTRRLR